MVVRNKKKKDKKKEEVLVEEAVVVQIEPSVEKPLEAAEEHKEEQVLEPEEDEVDDDWEHADIDKMARKIEQKGAQHPSGKPRLEEEEEKVIVQRHEAKGTKAQHKMKQALKSAQEEEKNGGDLFSRAAETAQSAQRKQQRLAEIQAKKEEKEKAKVARQKKKLENQ